MYDKTNYDYKVGEDQTNLEFLLEYLIDAEKPLPQGRRKGAMRFLINNIREALAPNVEIDASIS